MLCNPYFFVDLLYGHREMWACLIFEDVGEPDDDKKTLDDSNIQSLESTSYKKSLTKRSSTVDQSSVSHMSKFL